MSRCEITEFRKTDFFKRYELSITNLKSWQNY